MKTPISGVSASRSAPPAFWLRLMERFLTLVASGMCVRHKDALLFCIPGATGVRLPR
ncbi:hypothetical protein [Pseudomonas viridiflava]|uniref:hypothetical protein n=1 Tax=Pseudomonas viridiflava TaxID=33069 RepID=UPI0013CECF25|nr:hypothetical protein [Pseudomonas viridiflava]